MATQTLKDLLVLGGQSAAETPDGTDVLLVAPQQTLVDDIDKNDVIRQGDDKSEERIELGGPGLVASATLQWTNLTAADVGTIMEFWADPTKGRGRINTFLWQHPTELNGSAQPQQYVVRFKDNPKRTLYTAGHFGLGSLSLKVIGWYN